MSLREEQCKKVCRILDDVLANRPIERDSLIVAVRKAFKALEQLPSVLGTNLAEVGTDCISRQAAIDALTEYGNGRAIFISVGEAVIRMEQLPPARPEPHWIPCSERLPKQRESVIISVNAKYGNWVGEGCYWETTENHVIWKGYRWNATYWDDEIIAWMPLPEPYRGKEK